MRSILTLFFLLPYCLLVVVIPGAAADPQDPQGTASLWEQWERAAEEGVKDPLLRWHYYYKDGLRIDSREKSFQFRLNGRILGDGTGADDLLDRDFTDFEGWHFNLRDLRLSMVLTLYQRVELKIASDFSHVRDIKDEWIRLKKIPWIGTVTAGHMKEPFSLEELTSTRDLTFMERALPTEAFVPGRNFGVSQQTTLLNQRMTYAMGVFLNTGSYSNQGDAGEEISDANGWNITARVTGLPWYEDKGRRLLHLGLSYTHQFRNLGDDGAELRTRPESRLTDVRLVDTGKFTTRGMDRINSELALVSGPFSLQGEHFQMFVDSDGTGDPSFWGLYLFGSWFLTGEHRNYQRSKGVFSRIRPQCDFHFSGKGWGALEAALRFSFIDLNGGAVRGGREYDLTAGLDWYLNKSIRLMFNYVWAKARDRETPLPVEDGTAHIVQA
ncbi:MAG: hypothetical protein JRH00_17770, partial [Deltaproteobacteria bacterium]|nr:hypothetical protein [Deltaproteobacteria bacterium]